jgi:hypothetical protein
MRKLLMRAGPTPLSATPKRFDIEFTAQEEQDLINFLNTL